MSNNSTSSSNGGNANSGGTKGWFEGTMEVISGMEVISSLAPRPSTPVNGSVTKKKKRPGSSNNNNARGSMSAPSSPARSTSGFFPMINRLPSQDSIDRSIHNDTNSTHGKSASQIIRELKQSNAALSAKTATMEADFMNQLNHQTRQGDERHKRLEETIRKSEKLLNSIESRCKNAEQTLVEREEQLTKLREESAFQRHTISDLKNQLHQMELEQEESAYGKRDDSDKWKSDKIFMEQEMEDLRAQVQDSQVLQQEVDRLNHKLEDMKAASHANNLSGISAGDDESVQSQLGNSQRSSYTNRSFMKQSLPQTREILKKTKHRLSVTEAALDILKQERARMMHEHQLEVEDLQQHLEATEEAHHQLTENMKQTIQQLEQQQQQRGSSEEVNSSVDLTRYSNSAEQDNLRSQLMDSNRNIGVLQEQLRQATEKVNDLASKLDKVKKDANNQEQYRADEAEDLRVLHDAQEEEIGRLRKALDDINRELELRDEELEEQKIALTAAEKARRDAEEAQTEAPVEAKTSTPPAESVDPQLVANLKERLRSSEDAIERLETECDRTRKEHHDRVEHLETVLHEVTEGKEYAEEQLAQLSAVLVVDDGLTSRGDFDSNMGPSDELGVLHEDGTAADLSTMLRNVEKLQENERKAVARAKELEYVQAELEELRNSRQTETQELEELVARLKESEAKLASTRDGAMEEYRAEIQKLRGQLKAKDSQRVSKLDEQLREAQTRLNEFENEKATMAEAYMERIGRLELDKENVEEELEKLKNEKASMTEEHMIAVQKLEEDKKTGAAELESRESEIAQLKTNIDQICSAKDSAMQKVQQLEQDKNTMVRQHEEALSNLQTEKTRAAEEFMFQLQTKEAEISDLLVNNSSSSSAGEPTSDSDQVAVLKQEVEKLQKQLLEEQVVQQQRQPSSAANLQSGGALESDLRKQLEALRRERERESRTLKEKLEDRDTTISALVKSSVVLEQKISDLSLELQTVRQNRDVASAASQSSASAIEQAQDDVSELREALADYKEVETRLIHELSLSKKQLKFAESEISRLQEIMDDEVSVGSHHYRRQIQERDDAVSALVQQSMTHESTVQELQKRLQRSAQELEAMREDKKRSSVQLKAELRRLHQESEIFAGQIIEQDEELEALRAEIHNRDESISALNRQLTASRGPSYRPGMLTPNGESPEVVSLSAQIDELEEANETYRTELRELRFKLRDFDNIRNELARTKYDLEELERNSHAMAGQRGDLQAALAAREEAEQRLEEALATRDANSKAIDLLARERDALVAQRDKVIEELRRNIDGCTSQIEALETEIDNVHAELRLKNQALEAAEKKISRLESQNHTMTMDYSRSIAGDAQSENQNSALFEEIEDLQQQLKDLEAENDRLSAFKEKMNAAENLQMQSGKIVEAYERKLSLLTSDKDATIDSLQKSLMSIKGQAAEDFEAMTRDMKKFDLENQTLRQEMQKALEQKNNQIFALEHTLDAQEQLVGNMKNEMDHLQGSMVNTASSRREEIEDMEREVLDLTTRNAAFEREITALKMQLEESKLVHMAEVAKLRESVDRLSQECRSSPEVKPRNPIDDFPIHEVKERLEKLRWRNNSIQEENFKLKSRLEKAEAEIQSARNEKYRTANLEAKVGALTRQLEKLERENHVAMKAAKLASSAAQMEGSRSGTPLRHGTTGSMSQEAQSQASSRSGSRQGTPQRKRTPLRPRPNAQKQQSAPDTPSRLRGLLRFPSSRKKDRDRENVSLPQPQPKTYLVPPSNAPSTPQSERIILAPPMSAKSIQSAK
ncbi:myosin, heavy chain 11, smooth muscle [Seminavis robusta]|uniref:Myosin, heavy chain 11, smooth muscle n=1 Tax=Seminavis robusta TaxID=568900 RepID=A0A9N8H926_9STRA|nr:myosin, heavy chain 11, smooth muscle [Seminavis robusta]|eukprot:Sro190_g081850.1 myosin, heavy chain 11, smooth muscle (1789) ;mRNA; r:48696-54137